MNDDYAIEPSAFSNAMELRFVLNKFGFSEGRFLAQYPKNWVKRLDDSLASLQDVERSRVALIIEKSRKAGSLGTRGWAFDGGRSWVDNVASVRHALAAVAVAEKNRHGFPLLRDVLDDSEFFRPGRSERIEARPEEYVRVAKPLLSASHQVVLVDPYFDPIREGYIRTVLGFTRAGGEMCNDFVAVCNHEKVRPIGRFQSLLEEHVAPHLRDRQQFTVRVVENFGKASMHGRYLLTDKGGIRFDSGFDEKHDGRKVDVEILDRNLWDAHYRDYVQQPSPFKVIKNFSVRRS